MTQHPSLDALVLKSLVEGVRARAGAKERFRTLSEYEIARRAGVTDDTYAGYEEAPERWAVREALGRLAAAGLVRSCSMVGRYETFEPTDDAVSRQGAAAPGVDSRQSSIEARLDEIIRLLRAIERHLASQ